MWRDCPGHPLRIAEQILDVPALEMLEESVDLGYVFTGTKDHEPVCGDCGSGRRLTVAGAAAHHGAVPQIVQETQVSGDVLQRIVEQIVEQFVEMAETHLGVRQQIVDFSVAHVVALHPQLM